ncbi:MAG: protein phosphatase 2C domain-containing protein [Pseudomonadota bacterium]
MADLRIQAVAASHIGRRVQNEDHYLVDREHRLLAVADGVGGYQAGERAAEITCGVLEAEVAGGTPLAEAVMLANRAVRKEIKRSDLNMGSTLVAMLVREQGFELVWAGDSRAYLWDGRLKQISRDHSPVEAMYQRGELTRAEAHRHPDRNVINQGIGLVETKRLELSVNAGSIYPGQLFLLCSDGVSDVLEDEAIAFIVGLPQSLEARCMQLVSTAVGLGGQDNATAILVEVLDAPGVRQHVAPEVFWEHDPAAAPRGMQELKEQRLVGMELDSERLPPEITQVISIADVERELKARERKQGLMGRLLGRLR